MRIVYRRIADLDVHKSCLSANKTVALVYVSATCGTLCLLWPLERSRGAKAG
jgi:hypothetical protein